MVPPTNSGIRPAAVISAICPRPHGDLEEVFPISFKGDSNI
ncbi:hypothetical protein MJK97_24985, partial [Salmonella enterica subsp. enterica serovar Lubbock]|nr:hypothetical protein [Salmonella enterica subsp. enterica serovar Lubbock]